LVNISQYLDESVARVTLRGNDDISDHLRDELAVGKQLGCPLS
jgi:hypothetical protein